MVFSVAMPAAQFPNAVPMNVFQRAILESIGGQRGVRSAGATTHLPLSGQDLENSIAVEGYASTDPTSPPVAALRGVSPAYTTTMGIGLRAGRHLAPSDDENGQRVTLVNEAFVDRYLGKDPIGRIVYMGGPDGTAYAVVGVVADVRHRSLDAESRPEMFIPYVQLDPGFATAFGRGLAVVVHTDLPVAAAADLLRSQVRAIDANIPLIDLRPMDELVSDATAPLRFRTFLLTGSAGLALILAVVGIFGVLAYTVSQRAAEIGLRLALGARPANMFRQVLSQGGRLILAGTVVGLGLSLALRQFLRGLLFEVSPSSPAAYAAAAILLSLVALAAAAVPAWRATRVDPVRVLRG
jgi:putative ABC transport system permease protein